MENFLRSIFLLCTVLSFNQVSTMNFPPRPLIPPPSPRFHSLEPPHRLRRVASESRPMLRVLQPPPRMTRPAEPATTAQYHGSIKRGGPPYLVIRPMVSKRPRQNRRLVLTLPKDNIQILNAEAMSERGSQILPTTLTLSLRDPESDDGGKESRYSTTRSYVSQIPSPPRQSSRFHYGFVPMAQADSEEEERIPRKKGRWSKGEVSYEFDDLVGTSGGHVTVIKAHAAAQMPKLLTGRKYRGGTPVKSMKAIIIEPKEIEAKRVRVVETNAEKVSPAKARFVKAGEPMVTTAVKAKTHPLAFKQATLTKSKGEDWAASNVHFVNAEPPQDASERHQEEVMPHMSELQCGGTNDLGWCDLGTNYPSTEVSQIMEVCEELVSRMYVEVPENAGVMEDIASYSLSRNISENGPRAYWPWKENVAHFKKPLCDVERDVIKPSFAQDIRGKWHVIIQTEGFPQRIALEVCSKPGEPCSGTEFCSKTQSQCVQKYSHHQLISFDPESAETCPYVRLYKFPTSCVCRTE